MIILALIIFLLAYPVLLGYRDYLIFPVKMEVSKAWHKIGFIIRAFTVLLLLAPYYIWIPLYSFYLWSTYDLVTSVGSTSWFDRKLGEYSPYIIGLIGSTCFIYMSK